MIRLSSVVASRRPARPSLFRLLGTALRLRRERNDLRRLPPHMLRDIGLTEAEALEEAERPFWDVPSHWRR